MPLRLASAAIGPATLQAYLRPRRVMSYAAGDIVFRESEPADVLYFVESGRVKLSRVSEVGREAIVALLTEGDFLGESCLIGEPLRLASAECMTTSRLWEIGKDHLIRLLRDNREFSETFVAYLLARNVRYQDDFADQLFNSTEKRLARTLLLLARFGGPGEAERAVAPLSHEELAQIVGTTRARITYFMNRFRRLGLVGYDRHSLRIRSDLVKILLHD